MAPVNRVHWIRARAQNNRWHEELTLTGYEMQWTVRYFKHQARKWEKWGIQVDQAGKPGAAAYATAKVIMWTQMASHAEHRFMSVNAMYKTTAWAAGYDPTAVGDRD
jgi:hypothetical protein